MQIRDTLLRDTLSIAYKYHYSPLFICYMPLSHKTGKKVR